MPARPRKAFEVALMNFHHHHHHHQAGKFDHLLNQDVCEKTKLGSESKVENRHLNSRLLLIMIMNHDDYYAE